MSQLSTTAKRAGWRFASSLPALFGVLVFTFLLMRVLPGDPAVFFASDLSRSITGQALAINAGHWLH